MKSRTNRILYYFFYILFSPDTWRILIGCLLAMIATPILTDGGQYSAGAKVVIWVMVLGIGYTLANSPAKFISKALQRFFTRNA